MSEWKSAFAPHMTAMLDHKLSLGYSESSYVWYLNHFDRFCTEQFPNETVLTKNLIMKYACARDGEPINTLNRRLATIRELARHMNSLGISAYLLPPRMTGAPTRYIPHIFTDEELSAFFCAADRLETLHHKPLVHYIVPVLFRLIYCCGLRPGEGRLVRTSDIDLNSGRLHIRESKRHKDRVVMLSEDLHYLCGKYDRLRRIHATDDIWFFPRKDGCPYDNSWLERQFRKVWEIAGVRSFSSPKPRVYDFRHTFATRKLHDWMDAGEDLYQRLPYLSAYMGHREFSSTAYYIHLLPQRLVESVAIDWQSFSNLLPEVSP